MNLKLKKNENSSLKRFYKVNQKSFFNLILNWLYFNGVLVKFKNLHRNFYYKLKLKMNYKFISIPNVKKIVLNKPLSQYQVLNSNIVIISNNFILFEEPKIFRVQF